jgi:hypothetical protein
VLVLFEGGEVWSLETGELGRMRLQAGPPGSSARLIAPALAQDRIGMTAKRLAAGGIAVWFHDGACVVDEEEPTPFLWDRDEDGVLDDAEGIDGAEWHRRGYWRSSAWR